MARTELFGICRKCGKEYLKPMDGDNGRLCMECNWERRREEESADGLIAEVQLDYAAAEKGMAEAVIVVTGCGYQYRDQLKAIGYVFTRNIPSQRMWNGAPAIRMYTRKQYFAKRVPLDGIEAAIFEIASLGGKCAAPEAEELQKYMRLAAEGAQKAAVNAVGGTQGPASASGNPNR